MIYLKTINEGINISFVILMRMKINGQTKQLFISDFEDKSSCEGRDKDRREHRICQKYG